MSRLLITGAGGRFGAVMRTGLARAGRTIHSSDIVPIRAAGDDELVSRGDLSDLTVALDIVRDVDAVLHTAGIPDEAPFDDLVDANMRATYNVFEAARRNGVPRVIFTSSAHVVGFYPRSEAVDEHNPPRPDSLYGVTKVFGEGIGSLYASKYGMDVACLRIGSFRPQPEDVRQLSTWLSPRDAVHLVEQCLDAEHLGFTIIYGVSDNPTRWWRDSASDALGFRPADNGADYAHTIPGDQPQAGALWQGGIFAEESYRGGAG